MDYLIHPLVTRHYPGRVSPFGDLRIKAYLRLPEAFRSLSRPSSAISALASTLRSFSLDLACLLLLPKTYCSRSLMEGASHCVYLSRVFAASPPLSGLDWILTFSSFRFIFPVQFSRCVCAPRPRPCRAAGFVPAVLWCPRHSALASLGRLLGLPSTS